MSISPENFSKNYLDISNSLIDRLKHESKVLGGIEKYIYTGEFNHVYLYDEISNKSVLQVKLEIDEFNLKAKDPKSKMDPRPVIIHINSPGGDLISGLALLRVIEESSVPIIVLVEGISASAATYITVAANYRLIAPNATILIHQYSTSLEGKHEDIMFESYVGERSMDMLTDIYKKYTRLPEYRIKEILRHDLFLTPTECLHYGLVDKILEPTKDIVYRNYFRRNKGYSNFRAILNKKELFNNIYLYGEYKPAEFYENAIETVKSIQSVFYATDQKPVQSESSNDKKDFTDTEKLIMGGDPKPIILHISDSSMFSSLEDILPIINTILLSRVPIYSIIDGPATEATALYSILCHRRYMQKYASIRINLAWLWRETPKYSDILKNTEVYRKIALDLFKKYTKLPKNILDTLFIEQHYFDSEACLKYGLCDAIV
jgi:ATP-dependent protease ClpP protease subunit